MYKFLPSIIAVSLATIVGCWILFAALARLSGSVVSWWWPANGSLSSERLFDVTRSTATLAALLGGLFAILYAYRKQRVDEAASHRADAEALSKRYQEAADQIGHASAASRLAGVYALSRLADEWPAQRQTCVDVLCAYLRMPWPEDAELSGDLQVRASIVRLIDAHITRMTGHEMSEKLSWADLKFDFSDSHLVDFRMSVPDFHGDVSFARARFSGESTIYGASFHRGLDLTGIMVVGKLEISRMSVGSNVLGDRLQVASGGVLQIAHSWTLGSAQILMRKAAIDGVLKISAHPADRELRLAVDDLQAGDNARISIMQNDVDDEIDWLVTENWKLQPKSLVWLPSGMRTKRPAWIANIPRKAVVHFSPPGADLETDILEGAYQRRLQQFRRTLFAR